MSKKQAEEEEVKSESKPVKEEAKKPAGKPDPKKPAAGAKQDKKDEKQKFQPEPEDDDPALKPSTWELQQIQHIFVNVLL